jgi:hypothetical protein
MNQSASGRIGDSQNDHDWGLAGAWLITLERTNLKIVSLLKGESCASTARGNSTVSKHLSTYPTFKIYSI